MRIRSIPLRIVVVSCVLPWLVFCGDGEREPGPDESAPEMAADTERARIDTAGAIYGGGGIANGQPMPSAERAGGIPPYPNAVVWVRAPRDTSKYLSLEAFTPDSVDRVIAFYDSLLPGWTRTKAPETMIYERPDEGAAVTVQPWEGDELPPEVGEALKKARTAIGTAWPR